VDLLQKLYPGGELRDAGDGRRSYSVPPNALTQSSGVLARRADGRTFHVNHFGELPTDARLPASITWSAGVLFPRSGEYEFHVVGPGSLRIDDVPVARRVLAARGMHFVELLADVPSPDQAPSLQLQEAALEPRHTYARMDAQWGLFVHVASPVPPALPSPADGVLDSTVAMAFFDPELAGGGPPNSLTWSGTLLAPTLGVYRMAFAAEDPMQLEVDHQRVEVVNVAPDAWSRVGQGSLIPLSAGPHDVRITLQVTHGGREVARWNWVPPLADGSVDASGQWSVVPPMVLRPDQPPVRALP
ncbi:MAG TPA: PA14 domain-containing protein, partial [Chloroflexota bacterium]|nr:PA14 domain-containing protein [Chloroflexota bacterium]